MVAHICNHCGAEMRDLVVSGEDGNEVVARWAYEPNPDIFWFYACPTCGNVQIFPADLSEMESNEETEDQQN